MPIVPIVPIVNIGSSMSAVSLFLYALALIRFVCGFTASTSFRSPLTIFWDQAHHHHHISNDLRSRYLIQLATKKGDNGPDLFEYFDPLLSPHAYPKGIEAEKEKRDSVAKGDHARPLQLVDNVDDDEDSSYDPFQWSSTFSAKAGAKTSTRSKPESPFGINLPTSAASMASEERPAVDTSTTFDPTLSPHAYAKGAPDVIVGDKDSRYISRKDANADKKISTIGVLLIDHGSKNEKSNHRLEQLATLYQAFEPEDEYSPNIIVKACHMEIASPSIQDGISSLLEAGAEEIICHPFFLSPGRHVTQDIPQLVQQSIEALSVQIPVRTTEPVGSQTDVMLRAIHSLVVETSQLYKQ